MLGWGSGTGECAVGMAAGVVNGAVDIDPRTGRVSVATVQRIERLVGGDRVTEEQILRFIEARYGARSLFCLPGFVAGEICRRPADFIRAAKRYSEPEFW